MAKPKWYLRQFVVAGVFGLGHFVGTRKAEVAVELLRVEIIPPWLKRQWLGEATKGGSNVQPTVNHMPDDDVDHELRENFTRKT